MQTIIGLGQAGCNIAETFKQYPQYNGYTIDTDIIKSDTAYTLERQESPESYEENFPDLKKTFLKKLTGDVLFITSCGYISGASLNLLSQIKNNCNISVLYIKPDDALLSGTKALQENLIFNVFQEYARSNVFERLYVIDNPVLANIIGDIPIKEYYNRLNEVIVSTMHMINVFDHSKPIMCTFSPLINTAKIATFGLVDYESGEEKMFFDLEIPREKRHYYAIPEKILESDGTLMNKIKDHVKKNREHDKIKISYGVFATNYEQPFIYCMSNSTLIQKNEKKG
tara:strand:- start:450 stop:1301 length:852 start_codon:yes stop_codon:yes gene_type:complete